MKKRFLTPGFVMVCLKLGVLTIIKSLLVMIYHWISEVFPTFRQSHLTTETSEDGTGIAVLALPGSLAFSMESLTPSFTCS